jgi:hypothetical protein
VQPCFLFIGDAFEQDARFRLAKSLLLDTLRGEEVDEMNLMSLSRVIVCTAVDADALKFRHYAISLKKSGTRVCSFEACACHSTLHRCSVAVGVTDTHVIGSCTRSWRVHVLWHRSL